MLVKHDFNKKKWLCTISSSVDIIHAA